MGDVATTSKATYGGPPRSVVGPPIRGATPPFEWPLLLARLLWPRWVRRAACSLAHCVASSRACSADVDAPAATVSGGAGASATAVMMDSLRSTGQPGRLPKSLVCAETGRRRQIHPRTTFPGRSGLFQAAAVVGQALGDPGPVQVLQQRDGDPPGGPQRLAGLGGGERLGQPGQGP